MDKPETVCELLRKWHLPGVVADPTYFGPRHITGSPLLVLKSVSIPFEFDCPPFYVFGHVLMIDDLGNEYYIFRRQRNDFTGNNHVSHPLFLCETMRARLLNQCDFQTPRCLPESFTLHIFLIGVYDIYNPFCDEILVDSCLKSSLHLSQLSFDKDYSHGTIDSITPLTAINNVCSVDYEIFRHALVSRVKMGLVSDDSVEDGTAASTAVVVGHITAKNQAGQEPFHLFDIELGEPLQLEFGVMTELSTLAIPSSSVLSIEVNLKINNGDDNIRGSFVYEPNEHIILPVANVICGKRFKVIVFVYCAHAMRWLPEYDLREWCFPKRICRARSELEKWLDLDIEKHYCMESDASAYESESLLKCNASAPKSSRKRIRDALLYIPELRVVRPQDWYVCEQPQVLVELFCISVHWNSHEPVSKICGEIWGYHSLESFTMFNKQDYMFRGEQIQLLHPHKCLGGPNFQIRVALEDDKGCQISNGSVSYDYHTAEGWYNRRICSIIKGNCGYAAVYYTIFSGAIQAKLNFIIESKFNVGYDDVGFKVYGKIVARYNNLKYCTIYDKDYYQSVLFQKNFYDAVSLHDDGGIPLSKSVVAVPLQASLLVQACIFVKIKGESVKRLKISAHFNPEEPNEKLIIKTPHGSDYCSSVLVEWSK